MPKEALTHVRYELGLQLAIWKLKLLDFQMPSLPLKFGLEKIPNLTEKIIRMVYPFSFQPWRENVYVKFSVFHLDNETK